MHSHLRRFDYPIGHFPIGDTYDLDPRPDLINPNPDGPTAAAAP